MKASSDYAIGEKVRIDGERLDAIGEIAWCDGRRGLVIEWPNGRRKTLSAVGAGQLVRCELREVGNPQVPKCGFSPDKQP